MTMVPLKELADIERNGIKPDAIAAGTTYLGLEHIESGGEILAADPVSDGELASTKFQFGPEHLLYGKLRPYLAKIAMPDFDGICSTDILPVRPGPELDRKYLAYFLRQPSMVDYATARSSGANLPRLSPKALADFLIPWKPLPEQQRIAAILDQADALRRLRRQSLSGVSTLGRSVFYEMFGDPITNTKQFATSKLASFGTLDRGKSKHRPRNDPVLLGGAHPLIQTGDVAGARDFITSFQSTYSDVGLKQSRMWPRGTLCITIAANIADTAILDFDACFPDSVVGFQSGSDATNYFIHEWFKLTRGELERIAPAVAQKNINLEILRELDVIEPSDGEVEVFYQRMQQLKSQTKIFEKYLRSADKLFASIQQRAFRGEL